MICSTHRSLPLCAILPHEPEAGVGDDLLDDGRRDVAQLPPQVLPQLRRQRRLALLVVVHEVDARRSVGEERPPQRGFSVPHLPSRNVTLRNPKEK